MLRNYSISLRLPSLASTITCFSSPEGKRTSKLALDLLSGGMGFGICHVMLLERMAYFASFDPAHPAAPSLLSQEDFDFPWKKTVRGPFLRRRHTFQYSVRCHIVS